MKKKKLMLLGGIRYLLPVIEAAHKLGHHVITCDYLPDNIAHRYSDEYHNVSIVDKESVLKLARELEIDGIMSFAVDPGVETAAYVAEKMGLPNVGPYESVRILQNKDLFRAFLAEHGFNVPVARSFACLEEALAARDWYPWPVIIKPTDSAGSKGVTRVERWDGLAAALQHAFAHSISGKVIVEEFIEKVGCTSGSECFSVDGKLVFSSYSAQLFDETAANPFTPAARSWPSTLGREREQEMDSELQRLLTLLHMGSSIYNVECRIGTNGKAYLMEVSPRGGGDRLAEGLRYATGVDLIGASVRASLGGDVSDVAQAPYQGHWALVNIYASEVGQFAGLDLQESMKGNIIAIDCIARPGDRVEPLTGANQSLGSVFMKFGTQEELEQALSHTREWLKVCVEQ